MGHAFLPIHLCKYFIKIVLRLTRVPPLAPCLLPAIIHPFFIRNARTGNGSVPPGIVYNRKYICRLDNVPLERRPIMHELHDPLRAQHNDRPLADRRAAGRELRRKVPRSSHAVWTLAADRPDPLRLLEEQNRSRLAHLVPLRYQRMAVSPFTFLRGSAIVMAQDLATTPVTG